MITHSYRFDDISLMQKIIGPENKFIQCIAIFFKGKAHVAGDKIIFELPNHSISEQLDLVLQRIQEEIKKKHELDISLIESLLGVQDPTTLQVIKTMKGRIVPRTENQNEFVKAMNTHTITFCTGVAGTGKTFLAVMQGIAFLMANKFERLMLSRPAIEAGESLGFLPGDIKDKVDPYMQPIYDALYSGMPTETVENKLTNGVISIDPLAFMRGRTLSKAFVLLDEAQNTTVDQMKMFLTRLGENSRMVIVGDLTQTDLPKNITSGLIHAEKILTQIPDIAFIKFDNQDVVRNPLVAKIIQAYDTSR